MQNDDMTQPIQIFEGLYIGSNLSSNNLNDLLKHRIYNIINCASKELKNNFEQYGIKYLNFFWQDSESQMILDDRDVNLSLIQNFIEVSFQKQQNVMVLSYNGQCRAVVVVAAYLMKKFEWPLMQTLEYLNAKHPGLLMRKTFLDQLNQLEKRMFPNNYKGPVVWQTENPLMNPTDKLNELANQLASEKIEIKFSKPDQEIRASTKQQLTFRDQEASKTETTSPPQKKPKIDEPEEESAKNRAVSFGNNQFKFAQLQTDTDLSLPKNLDPQTTENPFTEQAMLDSYKRSGKVSPRFFQDTSQFQKPLETDPSMNNPNSKNGSITYTEALEDLRPFQANVRSRIYYPSNMRNTPSHSPPSVPLQNRNPYIPPFLQKTKPGEFTPPTKHVKFSNPETQSEPAERIQNSRGSDSSSLYSNKTEAKPDYNIENHYLFQRKNGYQIEQSKHIKTDFMERSKLLPHFGSGFNNPRTPSRQSPITMDNLQKTNSNWFEQKDAALNTHTTLSKQPFMNQVKELIEKVNNRKPSPVEYHTEPPSQKFGRIREIKVKSVSNSPQRISKLPEISPTKPTLNPRLKSIYENPDYFSLMRTSIYNKLGEEKALEKNGPPTIFKRQENIMNDLFKKKYEEMQYLENLFSKRSNMETSALFSAPEQQSDQARALLNTYYKNTNFAAHNLS